MNQTAKRVQTRQRERDAIRYRLAGATYADIGDKLGISEVGAYKIVRRVLEREAKTTAEESEEIRSVEIKRLDAMLVITWKKAAQGDLGAVDRILRIMERRSRLLGLDAPERVAHSGSLTVETIDKAVQAALSATGRTDADRS